MDLFETPPAPKKLECPTCGTPDEHGEDFCFECGHTFTHGRVDADAVHEGRGTACPMCESGEIEELSYGVHQCDRCGYTARDWSPDDPG